MAKVKQIFVPHHKDLQRARVLDIKARVGQKIKLNNFVLTLLQANGTATPILSPYTGLVVSIKLRVGDVVSPGSIILTLEIDTAVEEEEIEEYAPPEDMPLIPIEEELLQIAPETELEETLAPVVPTDLPSEKNVNKQEQPKTTEKELLPSAIAIQQIDNSKPQQEQHRQLKEWWKLDSRYKHLAFLKKPPQSENQKNPIKSSEGAAEKQSADSAGLKTTEGKTSSTSSLNTTKNPITISQLPIGTGIITTPSSTKPQITATSAPQNPPLKAATVPATISLIRPPQTSTAQNTKVAVHKAVVLSQGGPLNAAETARSKTKDSDPNAQKSSSFFTGKTTTSTATEKAPTPKQSESQSFRNK